MAEKPTVQIVLPLMPNPKDFETLTKNPTANGGFYLQALMAWEKICNSALERGLTFVLGEPSLPRPVNDGTKH